MSKVLVWGNHKTCSLTKRVSAMFGWGQNTSQKSILINKHPLIDSALTDTCSTAERICWYDTRTRYNEVRKKYNLGGTFPQIAVTTDDDKLLGIINGPRITAESLASQIRTLAKACNDTTPVIPTPDQINNISKTAYCICPTCLKRIKITLSTI